MAKTGFGFSERFERFSQRVAHAVGRPWAFLAALVVVLVWGLSGLFRVRPVFASFPIRLG